MDFKEPFVFIKIYSRVDRGNILRISPLVIYYETIDKQFLSNGYIYITTEEKKVEKYSFIFSLKTGKPFI